MKAIADTRFLVAFAKRYAGWEPDLADLCLITTDVTGFRVYRRGRREAIPLICPPGVR